MPLASLSTFAVMNPGPTTAKISRIRIFQRLSHSIGHVHRGLHNSPSQNKREIAKTTTRKIEDVPERHYAKDITQLTAFDYTPEDLQILAIKRTIVAAKSRFSRFTHHRFSQPEGWRPQKNHEYGGPQGVVQFHLRMEPISYVYKDSSCGCTEHIRSCDVFLQRRPGFIIQGTGFWRLLVSARGRRVGWYPSRSCIRNDLRHL